jgi:hypothetical protein
MMSRLPKSRLNIKGLGFGLTMLFAFACGITTAGSETPIDPTEGQHGLLGSKVMGEGQIASPGGASRRLDSDTKEGKGKQGDGIEDDGGAGEKEFIGIKFGVGISMTINPGGPKHVESAEVVNGLVRVSEEQTRIPRVMLETHYFFEPSRSFIRVTKEKWGFGPFVCIQGGENEIINALGAGMMLGFRYGDEAKHSWNFGVGAVWDPKVKVLGDGIEENRPLPAGETEVRFKNISEVNLLLLWSFSF